MQVSQTIFDQQISATLDFLSQNLNWDYEGDISCHTPLDGRVITNMSGTSQSDIDSVVENCGYVFNNLRRVPAPKRGAAILRFRDVVQMRKIDLAKVITLECGKPINESLGEVQEVIDICDFAVGLSRQLYGLTIASERDQHAMSENWHPLGPVLVISAFNFPMAVWAWNATIAIVCGNPVVWKPSEHTPLSAMILSKFMREACEKELDIPNVSQVVIGGADVGSSLVDEQTFRLVSATGSCGMGAAVQQQVSKTLGRRCLLELGGNNAAIVTANADLNLAARSVAFGVTGTTGQRCTSTRRLLVDEQVYDDMLGKILYLFQKISKRIGNPFDKNNLSGPLINKAAWQSMRDAMQSAADEGGFRSFGYLIDANKYPHAYYPTPALFQMPNQTKTMLRETFAPILYLTPYAAGDVAEAVALNNEASQGLSACIFTSDIKEAEYFKHNCDCGIANVNIGTSGAEIGGAFGGEKETGGGREAGSDSWKAYMRRQTSTTYFGSGNPQLSQGLTFDVKDS